MQNLVCHGCCSQAGHPCILDRRSSWVKDACDASADVEMPVHTPAPLQRTVPRCDPCSDYKARSAPARASHTAWQVGAHRPRVCCVVPRGGQRLAARAGGQLLHGSQARRACAGPCLRPICAQQQEIKLYLHQYQSDRYSASGTRPAVYTQNVSPSPARSPHEQ